MLPIIDKIKKNGLMFNILIFGIIFISILSIVIALNIKKITIIDKNQTICIKTLKNTVEEVMEEQHIKIDDEDIVSPSLDSVLEDNMNISIQRALPITIHVDGSEMTLKTNAATVQQVLEQMNVRLCADDIINYELTDEIYQDMQIKIVRVNKEDVTIKEQIPFNVVRKPNRDLSEGRTRVIEKGVNGVKEKNYSVIYYDNKEVSRQLTSEEVMEEPVDRIEEYGASKVYVTSRGETIRYKKILNMRATAYDLSYECCGKNEGDPGYGITYTGMKARKGVVAVDPSTIPLFTRLYIEAADGSWSYGYAVAGDTGSAVKSDIIDLYYDDHNIVKNFGSKKVKVYILTD